MVDVLEILFSPFVNGLGASIGVFLIRVFVGILFIVHGAPKIMGPFRKPMRDGMRQIGIPGVLFDLVGLLEFLGGIALIIGFLTRVAAALLAIEMLSTTILYITSAALKSLPRGFAEPMFKATKGYMFGWELDTVLLASCAALAIIGPGFFSIDNFVYQLLYR
ncbi:MAG: DoxX family protein [Sulfolobales archaeon]